MECYESLNEIIRASTQQNAPITQQLVPMVLQKLETTLAALSQPGLGPEAQEKIGEVQGLLCGTLQTIVQKLSGEDSTKMMIIQFGDQIMQMLLRVLGARSATVHEEAMLCVGALAYATGDQFEKYMQALYPFIEVGLKNHEEYEVCNVTVGVVGDLCRALDAKILPFCDGIVYQLLQDLQSTALHRSVKPPILSCFGDIALAIGPAFEKYVGYVVPMLQSAQQLSLSPRVHSWVAEQRRDRKASTAPTMFIAQGKQAAEKLVDKIQDRAAMLNPIGWALRPVHQYTYQALVYIRIAVRLVSWDDSVQTSLAATLGTAATASAALGVTVVSTPTIVVAEPPGSLEQEGSTSLEGASSDTSTAITGVLVTGLILMLVAGAYGAFVRHRRMKRFRMQPQFLDVDVSVSPMYASNFPTESKMDQFAPL